MFNFSFHGWYKVCGWCNVNSECSQSSVLHSLRGLRPSNILFEHIMYSSLKKNRLLKNVSQNWIEDAEFLCQICIPPLGRGISCEHFVFSSCK